MLLHKRFHLFRIGMATNMDHATIMRRAIEFISRVSRP